MDHTSSSTQQDHVSNIRHDPVPLCMAKKWLPVSHRHGCAIYRHDNISAEQQDLVGGELMVSAIIKGSPEQCLAALTDSNNGNSILGPATAVEVLQQSADGSSKVLQISLQHPCSNVPSNTHSTTSTAGSGSSDGSIQRRKSGSWLTRLCCRLLRHRCAVVQQTLWQDPRGIYCITFASLTAEEQQCQQQQQQIHQLDLQHVRSKNGSSFSSRRVIHSHCNGNTLPVNGSRSLPGSGCESCAVHNQQQQQHQQQQQQQHAQHQQQPQQQQLRHRAVSAPGHSSPKKQANQAVQLHACCYQQSSGDGSSSNSNHHHRPPVDATQQSLSNQQQQQLQPQLQQQQQGATLIPLVLQPLYLLISWLGSLLLLLASLLGCPCSGSSNSSGRSSGGSGSSNNRSWGLLGPVRVSVVGGFTVAGLGGEDNGGIAAETLVTSILKVDLGGCLASSSPGSCSLLRSAAVRAGVVDAFVNQMLSAVEGVKSEVEHPPTVQQQQQQQHPVAAAAEAAWFEGVVANVTSVASMALAPLTTWLQGQRPQQQHQQQQQWHKHHIKQQHLQGIPDHHHHHRQQQPAAAAAAAAAGQTGSVARSSGGGRNRATAAATSAAGAAVDSGGGTGAAVDDLVGLDQQGNRLTGLCNPAFWSPLHQLGCPALFQVRGPNYLSDHRKVAAGDSAYTLLSVDLVSTPTAVHHLARLLPSVRRCRAASAFVINMMVPAANNVMNLVMTFGSSRPWPAQCNSKSSSSSSSRNNTAGSSSGSSDGGNNSSSDGSSSNGGDSGFENTLRRFLQSTDTERSNMFKMIPHIQVGPWVLQTMVGTTPVIMGRKLETTYHLTERYMEVDIDVTTCRTAGYIVQSIRGATTSLVVDLCYLLEGQKPNELPEELIGAVRFSNIDMSATTPLDVSAEIPSWPEPW